MQSYSMRVLITGANGQLGTALADVFPDAVGVDSDKLDISNRDQVLSFDMSGIGAIVNSAAYTKVDEAEKPENRQLVEEVNTEGVANLAELATKHDIPLVHVSTDYVFDGSEDGQYGEEDEFAPLNVYGATKAAGDLEATKTPKHYIFRTSWVIGEGNNFVRIMSSLAKRGVNPTVVNDQFGRLTFTDTLAEAIKFALENNLPFGTYNLTNEGDIINWADIAKLVFKLNGEDPERVTPISTSEYYKGKEGPIAKRPNNSALDLSKIEAAGFTPEDWKVKLEEYINKELENN
jgi:dTDP-4-dehydrorhamnose 3,5-epimerase/reductase